VASCRTALTDEGKETVRLYRVLRNEHQKFIDRLEGRLGDVGRFYSLLRRVAMRVSARNVLCGTADRIVHGPVNAEVPVVLPGGSVLTATMSALSSRRPA